MSTPEMIQSLRSQGFTVSIRHKRRKTQKATKSFPIKNGIAQHFREVIHPKGGETHVVITKGGVSYTGKAKCRENESFSKKMGVSIALFRALEIQAAHE